MAPPVRVRGLTEQEGQKLQRVVRRGSTSSVRFRRAMMHDRRVPGCRSAAKGPVVPRRVLGFVSDDGRFRSRPRLRSRRSAASHPVGRTCADPSPGDEAAGVLVAEGSTPGASSDCCTVVPASP